MTKPRLALVIPTGAPITAVIKSIETVTYALDKKVNSYQNK